MAAELEGLRDVAVNTFKEKILGFEIHFYVVRMQQSFLLWIGTEPNLEALAVAMPTRFVSAKCNPSKKIPIKFKGHYA